MMPPDYRLALTECGIWLRREIPRSRIHNLGAASVDLHTSFMVSAGLGQDAETAKERARDFVRGMWFYEKTPS